MQVKTTVCGCHFVEHIISNSCGVIVKRYFTDFLFEFCIRRHTLVIPRSCNFSTALTNVLPEMMKPRKSKIKRYKVQESAISEYQCYCAVFSKIFTLPKYSISRL